MENNIMEATVNGVSNKGIKGVLTKDNALLVFAGIGIVATAYHGFQFGKRMLGKVRGDNNCETKVEVDIETKETTTK